MSDKMPTGVRSRTVLLCARVLCAPRHTAAEIVRSIQLSHASWLLMNKYPSLSAVPTANNMPIATGDRYLRPPSPPIFVSRGKFALYIERSFRERKRDPKTFESPATARFQRSPSLHGTGARVTVVSLVFATYDASRGAVVRNCNF
ncbi:hypothetical protein J6590_045913 [Homalodisca vitripennis]|nr:hypothetical protein J6590_045913 [Homalodisca vitripennis]